MTTRPRRTNLGQMFAGSHRDPCAPMLGESAARASLRRPQAGLVFVACFVLAACSSNPSLSNASRIVNIGVELPMSGGEAANGVPTLNGVKLAVADINAAGGIDGYKSGINAQDDAVNANGLLGGIDPSAQFGDDAAIDFDTAGGDQFLALSPAAEPC